MQIQVAKGDNLWKIAKRYPVAGKPTAERVQDIIDATGMDNPNKLQIGDLVEVPDVAEPPLPRMKPYPKSDASTWEAPPPVQGPRLGLLKDDTLDRGALVDESNRAKSSALDDIINQKQMELDAARKELGAGINRGRRTLDTPTIPTLPLPPTLAPDTSPQAGISATRSGPAEAQLAQVAHLPEDMNPFYPDSLIPTPMRETMRAADIRPYMTYGNAPEEARTPRNLSMDAMPPGGFPELLQRSLQQRNEADTPPDIADVPGQGDAPVAPVLPVPPAGILPAGGVPTPPIAGPSPTAPVTPPPGGTTGPLPVPETPDAPPVPEGAPAPPPVAEAYKSPPDLVEMYTKLMDRSRNAARLDRGMTLIAAGLAQPQNRSALISMAAGMDGGGSGGMPTLASMIEMQKFQAQQADLARQRALIPSLIKEYGISPETAEYLDATGQLDDTIQQLSTPETEVVTNSVTGEQTLIDSNTGNTIKQLSGAKPRDTEYQKLGDGTQVLVYKDDKTRVDTGEKLTNISAEPDTVVVHNDADGSNVLFDKRANKILGTVTPAKDPETMELTRGDGSKALLKKSDGTLIKELSPPATINADDKDALARINAERAVMEPPKPPMTVEEFMTTGGGGRGMNIDMGGRSVPLPAPTANHMWAMNPDGTPALKNGQPYQIPIEGTAGAAEDLAAQQKVDAATKAAEAADKAGLGTDVKEAVKYAVTDQDIEDSIDLVRRGNAGYMGMFHFLPDSEMMTLRDNLASIKTTIGIQALTAMREASPNGAALGNVTEAENQMLQKDLGSLNQKGQPEVLLYHLRRVQAGRNMIVNGVEDSSYTNPNAKTPEQVHRRPPTPAEIAAEMNRIRQEEMSPVDAEPSPEEKRHPEIRVTPPKG